jgi:hypothetical protein
MNPKRRKQGAKAVGSSDVLGHTDNLLNLCEYHNAALAFVTAARNMENASRRLGVKNCPLRIRAKRVMSDYMSLTPSPDNKNRLVDKAPASADKQRRLQ